MMTKTKSSVAGLATLELDMANQTYQRYFNSPHEGWAITYEEVEEANECGSYVDTDMKALFFDIRMDASQDVLCGLASRLYEDAINAASEYIQVAAMAQKFMNSFGDKPKEESGIGYLDPLRKGAKL